MNLKTSILVALLASVVTAGPAIWRNDQCASECIASENLFYEIGRTYEYKYVTETTTSTTGESSSENSVLTKVSAKVLIQPVTPCEFVLSLKDVSLEHSPNSDEFATAIMQHPLRFSFQNGVVEDVCGTEGEQMWVLNFKKGILSAFQNSMSKLDGQETISEKDILGECETSYSSKKEGSSILITKKKNPSECINNVYGSLSRLNTLGYAAETILQGLSLVNSEQDCTQKISEDIIKSVVCTESHTVQPFSASDSGAKTQVLLSLNLVSVTSSLPPITEPVGTKTGLYYESNEENSYTETKEKVEEILKQLKFQTTSGITKEVPSLFSDLVVALKGLDYLNIQKLYQENDETTNIFLMDALLLVRTPASTKMIVNLIKDNKLSTVDKSAWVTSLAFIKHPSLELFSSILPILDTQDGSKVLLGMSSLVYNYCSKDSECILKPEINGIIKSMESYIGVGCRSTSEAEKENILIALKALGNVGIFVNAESILKRCYMEDNLMEIRIAAIEAWRRTSCSYDRNHFLQAFNDQTQDNEIRIASYLAVMKCPTTETIKIMKDFLTSEGVNHVSSFVWTHLTNIGESAFPEKQQIGEIIREEMLQKKFNEGNLKLSRNFESSFYLTESKVGGMTEANVVFGSKSFLPRSAMFNVSVDMFGQTVNLFELGGRVEGFEKYMQKFFGPNGYYPEETIEAILRNLQQQNSEVENSIEEFMTTDDEPQASIYMKIFGNELMYKHVHDLTDLFPSSDIKNPLDLIKELMTNGKVEYLKNFNLIDTEFSFPTMTGFPINLKLSGAASVGFKVDSKFGLKAWPAIDLMGSIEHSAAVKFDASMIVDAFVTKSGIKMASTLHTSSLIDGSILFENGKLLDVTINVPKDKIDIFDVSKSIIKIENGQEVRIPSQFKILENGGCIPIVGMSMCYGNIYNDEIEGTNIRKLYLEKTDTHSSYQIQLKKDPTTISMLLDMPGSSTDRKWLFTLIKGDDKAFEVDFHSPYATAKADLTYEFSPSAMAIKGSIDVNGVWKYTTDLGFQMKSERDLNKGEFKIFLANGQDSLVDLKIKSTCDTNHKVAFLSLSTSGKYIPETSFELNANAESSKNALTLQVKSKQIALELEGTIVPSGDETSLSVKGMYGLYNSEKQSITVAATYKLSNEDDNLLFSGDASVKELDTKANWHLESRGRDYMDYKISGKSGGNMFDIDTGYVYTKTDSNRELRAKSLVNIPFLGIDYSLKKNILFSPEKYEYDYSMDIKGTNYQTITGRWVVNEELYVNFGINTGIYEREIQLSAKKLTPDSYKIELTRKADFVTDQGILTWNKSAKRFFGKLDASWHLDAIPYALKWDMNADQTELNVEGSFSRNGEMSTIFGKATPKSLSISNTFYKPLSIDANMEIEGSEKKFLITASAEEATFKISSSITPGLLQGEIKFGETDVGLTVRYQPRNLELEAWWSPTDKISIQGSYELGEEGVMMISVETPFQGYEKQVANLTYKDGAIVKQSQLSVTWANSQYLTVTAEFNMNWPTLDFTGSLKVSSTIEALERIVLDSKLNINDKLTFQINGKLNSEDMNGSIEFEPTNNGYKATLGFTSSFTIDLNAAFNHELSRNDISTTLQLTYGSEETKISVKGNFMNKTNMTVNILCQSPYLPEIMFNGAMETNSTTKSLELKGKYNQEKLSLLSNYETLVSYKGTICKLNLKVDATNKNLIEFSFANEINSQSDFKTEFDLKSELVPEYAIKGQVKGKISSYTSAIVTGFISGPKVSGRVTLNHKLINNSLQSELDLSFNSFTMGVNVNGQIDLTRKEGSMQSQIESSCPFLDGYKINLSHTLSKKTRSTLFTVSKLSSTFKLEHSLKVLDAFNWSNKLFINDKFGIDNIMSSTSDGIWRHEAQITVDDKTIETTIQVKMANEMVIEFSFNSPWTSFLKLTANHQSTESTKQSKIKFEYGSGKAIIVDSEYSMEQYNKYLTVSVMNEEWSYSPIKAEVKISTLDKKSFELFLTAAKLPSLLVKTSMSSDIKEIKIEVTGNEKYSIDCEIKGDLKVGQIKTIIYAPIMKAPMKTDITYSINGLQNTDFSIAHSYENSSDICKLDLKLRKESVNIICSSPNKNGSFLVTWKLEKETEKGSINMKLVSPFKHISDASLDIIFYKDFTTLYKLATFKYGTKEYSVTLKHEMDILSYFELSATTPTPGWETINLTWNFKDFNLTSKFSRNNRVYKFVGHVNANFQRGEAELTFTTPIEGYEKNKLYLQHSFVDTNGSLLFTSDVGSNKISVEYKSSIESLNAGNVALSIMTPWENIEKLSLKASFKDNMFKVTGIYNKYDFEWVLKTFSEGISKAKFSFNLKSNIPEWTSFEITGDLKVSSQSPFYAALKMDRESEVTIYSISASYDAENFNLEIELPKPFENIRANGKFYRENGYFKTYFSCSYATNEINFSGYVSLNGQVPDIKIKLMTPFEGKEHMEFALNGILSAEKSITMTSTIGKKQYLISVFVKSDSLSGKVSLDIKLPFAGFENFSFSSLFNLGGTTKAVKVNFIWNETKFILASKMNNMEIDIDIDSSIEEIKSFHLSGQHKKINNGYAGFGKISKNGIDYKFEGKAIFEENEFNIDVKVPSGRVPSFSVRGAFIDNGVTFSVKEENSLNSYDFKINYSLKPSLVFLNVATPFEFFSFGEIQYKASSNSLEGSITIKKYLETFTLETQVTISPMNSNIHLSINIPELQSSFKIFHDIQSAMKNIGFIYKAGDVLQKYILQFEMDPTFGSGCIKFESSYPGYEMMGMDYKFKWNSKNLKDIDTFLTLYRNEDSTTFGVKTAYETNQVICKFTTPFEGYEMIGFEAIKDIETNERKAKLMIGYIKFSLDYNFSVGNTFIKIETPFEKFNIFDVAAKYGWEDQNKFGIVKFVLNEIKYEISSEMKHSWTNPSFQFKIETPIASIPEINIVSQYNFDHPNKAFDFGVKFGDWTYWISGGFGMKNRSVFVKVDLKSPIEGWKFGVFETIVDLNNDDKLIRISLEREGIAKCISINGKLTNDEMKLKLENPFEMIPNFETSGSLNRPKRSLSSMMMSDQPEAGILESFHSFKVKVSTPFEKAKEVNFEISKSPKGVFALNYKRNDNFVDFELSSQAKKKGLNLTIKSALPGWELLAVTGRLSVEDLKAYISGQKNEKKMEITGSGTFTDKSGSMQITITTPYEKFKTISIDLDYNSRRNIVTLKANSDSSDFNILLEFKKGLTIEVLIPHPQQNTIASGKLSLFNGEFSASSRFPAFKTLSLKYGLTLGAVVVAKFEYQRNGIKVFELDFESNSNDHKLHLQIHGRLFGNHSMIHLHRDGFKSLEFVFHRNDKEFKVSLNGSGNLPKAGSVQFKIDNSFREIPKHIKGSLQIDRNASPRKVILEVEMPGKMLYSANLNYNTDIGNLRKGDFTLNIQTPQRDMRPWKKISGNWNLDDKRILTATINVGPVQYSLNGLVGLKETTLTIKANDSESTKYFIQWKIDRQAGKRDYFVKIGPHDRYVMLKLFGTFDTIFNADITGSFRISRFMNKDFNFTDKWSTTAGAVAGAGTFEFGTYKGTSQYTFSRKAEEKAAKLTWNAQTNVPHLTKIDVSIEYNIKKRMIDASIKWDADKLSIKTTLNNFSKLSSSNVIYIHLPKLGGGEITLSHDFTNPLSKSVKAVGKIGNRGVSYIASWTKNADLTLFDFNASIDSVLLGKATLHADFDFTNLNDAKANLKYKRNQDKFGTIQWSRKKSATHLENRLILTSSLAVLPSVKFLVTADWSKGFKLDGSLEAMNKSINVNIDFSPNKAVATIRTPFEKFGNIEINLEYSFKPKENVITFKYARGDKVINFRLSLEMASKKAGTIKLDLTTPFPVIKSVNVNGQWKKGVFSATYKRNDDVKVDFEGTADVKLEKSTLDLKFSTPNHGPVVLKFAYDLEKFITGSGKKGAKLIDLHLEIAQQTIHFVVEGFRNEDKLVIEVNGNTTLDKLRVFQLKLDSELNVTKRAGLFEINVNDFHYKVRNEFEKRKNGFYARSQMESSATPLPGLTLGFGRDGDAFIATIGHGDEREISISFKGKDDFKKGFSGKIDVPKRGINNLEYDVKYGFKSNDKLTTDIKITLSEGRFIEANFLYSSDGVKGRLLSPWTGDHSVRVRRSIGDDYFLTDVGIDDMGFSLEGKSLSDLSKKGFKLEGDIFGKKVLLDCLYDFNGSDKFLGKLLLKTPFSGFEAVSGDFMMNKSDKTFSTSGSLNFIHKISFNINMDMNNKFKGVGYFNLNDFTYEFTSNLAKTGDRYEGTVTLFTPHDILKKLSATGFFDITSYNNVSASFKLFLNDRTYDVIMSHTIVKSISNLDISYTTSESKEVNLKVTYSRSLKPVDINVGLSRSLMGEKIYDLTFKFLADSLRSMNGEWQFSWARYACKFAGNILTTENLISGNLNAKISDQHEFLFRMNLPSSSLSEIILNINSPKYIVSSLKITEDINDPKITVNASLLTKKGVYKVVSVYDDIFSKDTGLIEIEVFTPNTAQRNYASYKVSKNDLTYVRDINLQCGTSQYMFRMRSENKSGKFIVSASAQNSYLNNKKAEATFSLNLKDDFQVLIETLVGEETHNGQFHLSLKDQFFSGIIHTSLLPSGIGKLEASAKGDKFLNSKSHLLLTDTINTISSTLNLKLSKYNDKEVSIEIKTPFPNMKKLNFGIEYSKLEMTRFAFMASPLSLEAECYFGVTESAFNAGVEIKTGFENWELTEAKAYVPFNTFAPKLEATIYGEKYGLSSRINESVTGGEFMVQGFMGGYQPDLFVAVRTQVPYEFRTSSSFGSSQVKDINFGIVFDSSILSLMESYVMAH